MIRNAVVPVAGIGTRLFPLTKSLPKELLAIGRKPVIQHVLEELCSSGLKNVMFVTGKRKTAIENHFDLDSELVHTLKSAGKEHLIPLVDFDNIDMSICYTRQSPQLGLGHAIGFSEPFAGDEPFVVALGDTLVHSAAEPNVVSRLIDCYEKNDACCVIALQEVPDRDVHKYGIAKPAAEGTDGMFRLDDLIEKPSLETAPSNLAIAARYVFSPAIFEAIKQTRPGKGNEIQLTDAIKLLLNQGKKIYGVKMGASDRRYDIGTFESYYKCFVDFALSDQECGKILLDYIDKIRPQ